ncbi:GIY-YIG nuclease family protein [Thaumasiovibrio subtropicus]|uniref:GIY-YIG nuclease family protein n=1 Tax=Thaumasiovibrio subtropicus TaxID=1891207 RepID=UPI000B355ECB|nr:GIY-YIG nuclease family protein [Thaumasiovibrio subtropicus]
MASEKNPPSWWVYFIEASNCCYYCGITNDVSRRMTQHEQGKGAKYLRGKAPLKLVWSLEVGDKHCAAKIEYRLKQLRRRQKQQVMTSVHSIAALQAMFPDWSFLNTNREEHHGTKSHDL